MTELYKGYTLLESGPGHWYAYHAPYGWPNCDFLYTSAHGADAWEIDRKFSFVSGPRKPFADKVEANEASRVRLMGWVDQITSEGS